MVLFARPVRLSGAANPFLVKCFEAKAGDDTFIGSSSTTCPLRHLFTNTVHVNMTETLQAGDELDARVAEALGLRHRQHATGCMVIRVEGQTWSPFWPSTHHIDSFWAASRANLFEPYIVLWANEDGGFRVSEIHAFEGSFSWTDLGEGPDAQLAICAAILKVKP
jgi:hypothetical protein